jgi:hypothetical protein
VNFQISAFILKHGEQAHRDRMAKERAREDAAWEAQLVEAEKRRQARRDALPSR